MAIFCECRLVLAISMDAEVETLKRELAELVDDGILSKIQVDIFNDKFTMTYEQILKKFDLSGPVVLSHCLRRTALGRFWVPRLVCGPDAYLGPADERKFAELVAQMANDVNCLSTNAAVALAQDLRSERNRRARKLLLSVGCEQLAGQLPSEDPPCRSWLNSAAEHLHLRLCRAEELEIARRTYCDRSAVTNWFLTFSEMFNRHPALMFNMDETQLSSRKRMKVLCECLQRPLTTALPPLPHMTGAVTINGRGHRIRPLVILPNKKTLRSLEAFDGSLFFASSSSGWMTRNIFRYFSLIFVSELQIIRLRLPSEIRNEPALLFVDGHSSRLDFRANLIFWLFNVDVLSFPGHTSHLLQMFDVCVASPLKQEFKKEMTKLDDGVLEQEIAGQNSEETRSRLSALRSKMIQSFLTSCERTCTTANCAKGFAVTGVAPYNPAIVLENDFAMDPPNTEIYRCRPSPANSRWLTSEESLREMFVDEFGREMTEKDLRMSLSEIEDSVRSARIELGIPLSQTPPILWGIDENKIYKLLNVKEC